MSCILLFSLALNRLQRKYIWKILQVTELKSCTLSSTIHIFTKSRSLSLLPKASTKWKKLVAVLLKESSFFLVKLLKALRLNLIFTRVILPSVLVNCSVQNKIFSIHFLSSWIIKFFKPSSPKESKKKMSPKFNVEYAPPVRSALARGVCISSYERIFYFFFFSDIISLWSINLLISFDGKTPTKLFSISSSAMFLNASSIWKLLMPLLIFITHQTDYWGLLLHFSAFSQQYN